MVPPLRRILQCFFPRIGYSLSSIALIGTRRDLEKAHPKGEHKGGHFSALPPGKTLAFTEVKIEWQIPQLHLLVGASERLRM